MAYAPTHPGVIIRLEGGLTPALPMDTAVTILLDNNNIIVIIILYDGQIWGRVLGLPLLRSFKIKKKRGESTCRNWSASIHDNIRVRIHRHPSMPTTISSVGHSMQIYSSDNKIIRILPGNITYSSSHHEDIPQSRNLRDSTRTNQARRTIGSDHLHHSFIIKIVRPILETIMSRILDRQDEIVLRRDQDILVSSSSNSITSTKIILPVLERGPTRGHPDEVVLHLDQGRNIYLCDIKL